LLSGERRVASAPGAVLHHHGMREVRRVRAVPAVRAVARRVVAVAMRMRVGRRGRRVRIRRRGSRASTTAHRAASVAFAFAVAFAVILAPVVATVAVVRAPVAVTVVVAVLPPDERHAGRALELREVVALEPRVLDQRPRTVNLALAWTHTRRHTHMRKKSKQQIERPKVRLEPERAGSVTKGRGKNFVPARASMASSEDFAS
jgi:hypothetical protein